MPRAEDGTEFVYHGTDPRVKDAVLSVCRAAKLTPPTRWATTVPHCGCNHPRCLENSACGMSVPYDDLLGYHPTWVVFLSAPKLYDYLPGSRLYGVICHELGHYRNGDLKRLTDKSTRQEYHQAEFKADEFAIEMGMAEGLRDALEALVEDGAPRWGGSHTHPQLGKRIDRLNSVSQWSTGAEYAHMFKFKETVHGRNTTT